MAFVVGPFADVVSRFHVHAKRVMPVVLMCLTPVVVASQANAVATANRYRIVFDTNLIRPQVTAEVRAVSGQLLMGGWGADMHKRGWGHYIRDLQIREMNGSPASYSADTASAAWQLADSTSRSVRLSYAVDLSFAASQWPYGNEQAGSLQGRDLFVVSKALFITSKSAGPRVVEFVIPPGWHVAAPWNRSPESRTATAYEAPDDNALLNNSLVVGRTAAVEVRAGSFSFLLANLGSTAADRSLVADALTRVVREYVRIFPRTPPTSYVLTMFNSAERDAEAFLSSAAFSEVERLTRANRIQWAGTVAHELFHSWNGASLRPEPYADLQWFSEGFTDYYATRSLAKTGVIDEPLFLRRMERTIALYLYFKSAPAFNGITLKAAGTRKGPHRLGVYEGGWVVAFCLDARIREQSAGRLTLDDAMRLLYDEFAFKNQAYTETDLRRVLREVAGPASETYLDKYVAGNETIPVRECVADAGYRGFGTGYQAEYYVEPLRSSFYRTWLFNKSR
jgi:predicted metalloprotease with PDZ domain